MARTTKPSTTKPSNSKQPKTAAKKPAPSRLGSTTKKPAKTIAKPASKPRGSKLAVKSQAASKSSPKSLARPWIKSYPPGVTWDTSIDLTPVHMRVAAAAKRAPNTLALDFLGTEVSFGEMWDTVERFCGALQHQFGVKKGTRVALLLPNTPHYVYAYYAILLAGGIVVNCNPLYSNQELDHIVSDAGADILITLNLKQTFDKAEKLATTGPIKTIIACDFAAALPVVKSILYRVIKRGDIANMANSPAFSKVVKFDDMLKTGGTPKPAKIDPKTDVAVQQYTGGTTGVPKGAMLSHANIAANVSQIDAWGCGLFAPPSKILAVLPFFHIFAMTVCLNCPLTNGAPVIMMPKFDLKTLLGMVRRTKANVLPAVPTLTHAISNAPNLNKQDIASLEVLVSGGAALPNDLRRTFAEVSDALLAEGYGLTEASPVVCCAALRVPSKPMSIGQPIPGTDIRFVDIEHPTKAVPQGERGELQVKGPQVMLGYYKDDERTKSAFIDGWLRTGDVGYMDEEGYVFLVDRIKDLIISSGFNIYPRTIEEALNSHPMVDECNVIGVPDDYRGEVPVAFVKRKESSEISEDELKTYLSDHIAKIEMPAAIIFKSQLPKTLVGKLSKNDLRAEYAKMKENT